MVLKLPPVFRLEDTSLHQTQPGRPYRHGSSIQVSLWHLLAEGSQTQRCCLSAMGFYKQLPCANLKHWGWLVFHAPLQFHNSYFFLSSFIPSVISVHICHSLDCDFPWGQELCLILLCMSHSAEYFACNRCWMFYLMSHKLKWATEKQQKNEIRTSSKWGMKNTDNQIFCL